MNGMVFKRGAEGEIKKAVNARVAVYTCPFDLTQTETKAGVFLAFVFIFSLTTLTFSFQGTVLIENAEELVGFAKGEETEVEGQVKALADSGVQVKCLVLLMFFIKNIYSVFFNYHVSGCCCCWKVR